MPGLLFVATERHPKVPVGPRPWTLPRGLEVPLSTRTAKLSTLLPAVESMPVFGATARRQEALSLLINRAGE